MNHSFIIRICLYIAIIGAIINGWWFIALPLLLIGVWRLSFRIEIIIAGIMYDALFGMVHGMGWWGYIGTIVSVIIVSVILIFEKMIR